VKPTRRVSAWLQHLAMAAGGFLLAYLFIAFVVLPDDIALGDITIPGVVGLTQADAQRRLTGLGLKVSLGESRFSADAPKSTVLAQNPPAGSVVAPGTTISLDVSAGQQRATIPALVGLASEDAERELKKAGLQLGQLQEQPSDSARGLVLGSNPSDGQVVPLGTRVDLIVSAGPAQLTMPDVVGQDYESAAALLAQLGLVTAPPDHDPDSTLPRGAVVSQSPAAGASVAAGTTITLRVAGTP